MRGHCFAQFGRNSLHVSSRGTPTTEQLVARASTPGDAEERSKAIPLQPLRLATRDSRLATESSRLVDRFRDQRVLEKS